MFSSLKDLNSNINVLFYIAVFCLSIIYNVAKKFYYYREIRKYLPVIYGLPFLGIFYKCLPLRRFLLAIGSPFDQLKSSSYLTWCGNVPLIATIDPDIIKHILNSDEFLNKADHFHRTLNDVFPNGILTSKYFKWKHYRKAIIPSFTPRIMQKFIPNFIVCSKSISHYFESLCDGEEHAIVTRLKGELFEMAVGITAGNEMVDGEHLNGNLANNFSKFRLKLTIGAGITMVFAKLLFLIRTPSYYKIITDFRSYAKTLIKRKLDLNNEQEESVHFLDRAIKYQQQNIFSMNDTITETYFMIIAAFETISTSLYSLITMLAMHHDVQQKLHQEIVEVMGYSENIEPEYLNQMTYLNMVIDETLRLMPPIPMVIRESIESCNLTKDIKLPRDFPILISIFHLHRRPDLWGTNAEQFNPDNFLPENIKRRHPYAYIPFLKGARNCIGWRYALIALKVLAINLVRDFQFSTEFPYNKLMFTSHINLHYVNEPKIRIVKRKRDKY